jgi:hypothetical protein
VYLLILSTTVNSSDQNQSRAVSANDHPGSICSPQDLIGSKVRYNYPHIIKGVDIIVSQLALLEKHDGPRHHCLALFEEKPYEIVGDTILIDHEEFETRKDH